MKKVLLILALSGMVFPTMAREREFNKGWEFSRDSLAQGHPVDLPYDFSMEWIGNESDASHIGPFSNASPNGRAMGHLMGGTGWYRKSFVQSPEEKGKRMILLFDGAYMETEVRVNGKIAGNHFNGYTPFYYDITELLLPFGQLNEVVVKVRNEGPNSRWYSGSGLYREVSLLALEPAHIVPWGIYVTTPKVSDEHASVHLEITVRNERKKKEKQDVLVRILGPDGREVAGGRSSVRTVGGSSTTVPMDLTVPSPVRWSPDNPVLYTAEVKLLAKEKETDMDAVRFGIRTISVNASEGFKLNGEPLLLKGGCVHHDNGLLGAAAYRAAEYRRVRQLKESGYNAVRCAHNPPSRHFLDACDELGLLVMDEFTDMWEQPKNTDDYAQYFVENWERDLTDMMLRDRNHPSIVMWSIGNEIPNWSIADASRIGKQLSDKVKELDPTRLVTQGITGAYIHLDWDNSQYTFRHLDVSGYNYLPQHYAEDHAKFPNRVIVGTESYPRESYAYWKDVEEKPYVIGDFVWTALEHLGEAGCGSARYVDPNRPQRQMPQFQTSMGPEEGKNPAMMWFGGGGNATAAGGSAPRFPAVKLPTVYVNNCGDIDIIGDVKPQGLYRRVMWDVSSLEMVVHEPVPEGMVENLNLWGWPNEYAQWYWPGHEGEKLQVRVFTKEPQVRLELNGEVVGFRDVAEDYVAVFDAVEYRPGKLVAISLRDGKEVESRVLLTPGKPASVRILRERYNLDNSLAFLKMEVIDDAGVVVPEVFPLSFDIRGASFVSSGNGAPDDMESFGSLTPKTYRGGALLIVRPDSEDAPVDIIVSSPGLASGKAVFTGAGNDILAKNIGVGLCSVIGMEADFEDTLRRIAKTGATHVEFNNFMGGRMLGVPPEEARVLLDKYGLKAISDVTMASSIDGDNAEAYLARWEQTFQEDKILGVKYVSMTANLCWGTEPHALKCCRVLNQIGALAKKYGIQFLYHLHNIEFNPILDSDYPGQIVDFIAEHTDPELVKFQDDVFWVQIGGRDTIEFLKKYGDRIPMLHVKDFYFIGQGDYLDYKAIFEQFYANGGTDWVLEMEDPMTRQQMYDKAEGHNRMSQTREAAPGGSGQVPRPGGFNPGGPRPRLSAEETAARKKAQEQSRLKALKDIEKNLRTLEGMPFIK